MSIPTRTAQNDDRDYLQNASNEELTDTASIIGHRGGIFPDLVSLIDKMNISRLLCDIKHPLKSSKPSNSLVIDFVSVDGFYKRPENSIKRYFIGMYQSKATNLTNKQYRWSWWCFIGDRSDLTEISIQRLSRGWAAFEGQMRSLLCKYGCTQISYIASYIVLTFTLKINLCFGHRNNALIRWLTLILSSKSNMYSVIQRRRGWYER